MELKKLDQQQNNLLPTSLQTADWVQDGPEKDIYLANFHRSLDTYCDDSGIAQVIGVLSQWVVYLGVKDISAPDLQICRTHLLDEFPDWSLEKIRLAIKYSFKGVLKGEDGKPLDITPYYNSFPPVYISKVLNAFQRYSNKIEHGLLMEKKKIEEKAVNTPKILSLEEKIASRRAYLLGYQKSVIHGGLRMPDFNNVMRTFLSNIGLVTEFDHISKIDEVVKDLDFTQYSDDQIMM